MFIFLYKDFRKIKNKLFLMLKEHVTLTWLQKVYFKYYSCNIDYRILDYSIINWIIKIFTIMNNDLNKLDYCNHIM